MIYLIQYYFIFFKKKNYIMVKNIKLIIMKYIIEI
jgi:hypothetical protein